MRYELLYYELKEKKFNSRKTLEKFLNTLTVDQKLRILRKEKGIYYAIEQTPYGINEPEFHD